MAEKYEPGKHQTSGDGVLSEVPKTLAERVQEKLIQVAAADSTEALGALIAELERFHGGHDSLYLLVFIAKVRQRYYDFQRSQFEDVNKVIGAVNDLEYWVFRLSKDDPLVQKVMAYYYQKVAPLLVASPGINQYLKPDNRVSETP
jgi:hypothetical protein